MASQKWFELLEAAGSGRNSGSRSLFRRQPPRFAFGSVAERNKGRIISVWNSRRRNPVSGLARRERQSASRETWIIPFRHRQGHHSGVGKACGARQPSSLSAGRSRFACHSARGGHEIAIELSARHCGRGHRGKWHWPGGHLRRSLCVIFSARKAGPRTNGSPPKPASRGRIRPRSRHWNDGGRDYRCTGACFHLHDPWGLMPWMFGLATRTRTRRSAMEGVLYGTPSRTDRINEDAMPILATIGAIGAAKPRGCGPRRQARFEQEKSALLAVARRAGSWHYRDVGRHGGGQLEAARKETRFLARTGLMAGPAAGKWSASWQAESAHDFNQPLIRRDSRAPPTAPADRG